MGLKYMQEEIQTSLRSVVGPNKPVKLIYLDVAGRMHSLYKELLLSPPSGYRFVTIESNWDKVSDIVSRTDILYSLQLNVLAKLFPPNLVKAYLERFKKPPSGAVLTYSIGHLVFRKEPWVVDMEFVTQLTGYNIKHFKRFRQLIEKVFASEYCKKIICWTEAGKKTILLNLDCANFASKIEVVPLAVRKKDFVKDYNNKKVKLLFVGSANIPGEFEYKGGKEVLEAFFILSKKYKNIELVVRSDILPELKTKYSDKLKNVKIIEGIVPWDRLECEFKTADIFLFPTHSTPGLAILDAMSYELPVVTTNVWANTEMVENGKTGFVINKSARIQYYTENYIPNWSHYPTSKFMRIIKTTDPTVVKELVEKTSILIENEGLRRSMGRTGRQRIERGRFSINKRHETLKKIFDEVLEG
jgi:glycosyltransferase involved in cell wall biosynthesis